MVLRRDKTHVINLAAMKSNVPEFFERKNLVIVSMYAMLCERVYCGGAAYSEKFTASKYWGNKHGSGMNEVHKPYILLFAVNRFSSK